MPAIAETADSLATLQYLAPYAGAVGGMPNFYTANCHICLCGISRILEACSFTATIEWLCRKIICFISNNSNELKNLL